MWVYKRGVHFGSFFVKISGKWVYKRGVHFALSLWNFSAKKKEWMVSIQLTKARLPPSRQKKKGKKGKKKKISGDEGWGWSWSKKQKGKKSKIPKGSRQRAFLGVTSFYLLIINY